MAWDHFSERSCPFFWMLLDFDKTAADTAAACFPEFHKVVYGRQYYDPGTHPQKDDIEAETKAYSAAHGMPAAYRTDPKHPAYWIVQEYSFDEAASRAVTSTSMVRIQQEIATPSPSIPDRYRNTAIALIKLAASRSRAIGYLVNPDSDVARSMRLLETPADPPPEPFDPNDYPRFRVE